MKSPFRNWPGSWVVFATASTSVTPEINMGGSQDFLPSSASDIQIAENVCHSSKCCNMVILIYIMTHDMCHIIMMCVCILTDTVVCVYIYAVYNELYMYV